MPYLYHTEDDKRAMLDSLGLQSEEELLEQIPAEFRLDKLLPIETGKSEPETIRKFAELAEMNHSAVGLVSFLGGGVYDHVVPSVVGHIASRPEFATAYTPYQPEVSQGTLQVVFEFQTHIARLTGMHVANASMYDAASALAEASLMAAKIKRRDVILCAEGVNPRYVRVIERYLSGQNITLQAFPHTRAGDVDIAALKEALNDRVALFPNSLTCVIVTPRRFNVVRRVPTDVLFCGRRVGAD